MKSLSVLAGSKSPPPLPLVFPGWLAGQAGSGHRASEGERVPEDRVWGFLQELLRPFHRHPEAHGNQRPRPSAGLRKGCSVSGEMPLEILGAPSPMP